ncbi:lem3 cdc50 family protein [Lichtheimia corymbifera JMRC:FSU:9682]|uniref:Lem3 cdc50 family protein n=1 Tax=Lichtheimia corymbifera JMRC:FSU:9682 TaxID=1263082 RepID=A0A068S934_9FUNG|nr:lem3 cdc50 family protein [Lichtheimia corymbifera JMRC:FSU:9682]
MPSSVLSLVFWLSLEFGSSPSLPALLLLCPLSLILNDKRSSMSEHKSKKPANTAFKQQRLKAWQPLLTPKTVLPTLFAVGIVFAPLGGLFLYESETVNEIVIDYTDCITLNETAVPLADNLYDYKFTAENTTVIRAPSYWLTQESSYMTGQAAPAGETIPRCNIQFSIPFELRSPVYLYYRLTNFYQNHRKYVKSLSYNQLNGENVSPGDAEASCAPVGTAADGKIYYPCGLIANSMFNDTFSNMTLLNPQGSSDNITYTMSEKGIAWSSDVSRYKKSSTPVEQLTPPPNWQKRYPSGYTAENLFDPSQDEHFLVWMRTSWYPTFRKLYSKYESDPLQPGTYQIQVDMNYDIRTYGGTKSIVLSGTSFLGARNPFMGLAYIIMGCACAFLGVVFLGWHFFRPRKLGDHDRLSWNQSGGLGH